MKRNLFTAQRTPGFTLLELLGVIVIIDLLASYVGPNYFSHIGRSAAVIVRIQMKPFTKALGALRLDVGCYPITEDYSALEIMAVSFPQYS